MEIRFRDAQVDRIKCDLLVIPVREKDLYGPAIRALHRRLKDHLRARLEKSKFNGAEESTLLYSTAGWLPTEQILLIGLGGDDTASEVWRKIGARARKEAAAAGAGELAILFAPAKDPEKAAGDIVEGALLGSYQFNKYRSNAKASVEPKSLTLFRSGLSVSAAMRKSVAMIQAVVPSVFLARDLVNEPPSVATASFLGARAQEHCRGRGLTVEVWNKKKIK